MSKDINFEPPGIEALDPPLSSEIDNIIGQIDSSKLDDQRARDRLSAAVMEYRLEPEWKNAPNPSEIHSKIVSVQDTVIKLNKMMAECTEAYYVQGAISELVARFNNSQDAGDRLDLDRIRRDLSKLETALTEMRKPALDKETPDMRLAAKLMKVYRRITGKPLRIHGDGSIESGVSQTPELDFLRVSFNIAGVRYKSDDAIRSLVKRISKKSEFS